MVRTVADDGEHDRELSTARALWEAGRLEVRPSELRDAVRTADHDQLALLASVNGVAGMLQRALRIAGVPDALGEAGETLALGAELRRMEALLLFPIAMQHAIAPLADCGLEPLIFKGPALAARYPEPGLRPMSDIDVIVPREDHDRAVRALVGAGWVVHARATTSRYEAVLTHPEVPSLAVELHRGIDTWFQRSANIRLEDLYEARVPTELYGTKCFELPPNVELVALCAHAGKPFHTFSRLIWIVDLAVVSAAGIDWDEIGRLATAWRCRTMLALALIQARRIGVSAPDDLLAISGSEVRRAAIQPVTELTWPLHGPFMADRNRLRYALADRWTRRLILYSGSSAPAPVWEWPRGYVLDLIRALKWLRS